MASPNALILGGGIIALACAYRLQRTGHSISIAFRDLDKMPPSLGNAGHIAVEQVEPLASQKTIASAVKRLFLFGGPLDLPFAALGVWAPFVRKLITAARPASFEAGKNALQSLLEGAMPAWGRLVSDLDARHLLLADGHFVVWETEASAVSGMKAWSKIDAPSAAHRPLHAEELSELGRLVRAPVAAGIRFERSGQIQDLAGLRRALEDAIIRSGGIRINADASHVEVENTLATVILDDGTPHTADVVLVAAGVGSGPLMRSAGHATPIIAERGYHIEGAPGEWPERLPPVVFEDRSLIVTRFARTLRAASFVEFSTLTAPGDARKWRRLRRHASELGLPLKEPISEWMGARPTLPDYLPAMGRSTLAENLLYAFGHQHLGLTLAPITAEIIAEVAKGASANAGVAAFDLDRFRPRAREAPTQKPLSNSA